MTDTSLSGLRSRTSEIVKRITETIGPDAAHRDQLSTSIALRRQTIRRLLKQAKDLEALEKLDLIPQVSGMAEAIQHMHEMSHRMLALTDQLRSGMSSSDPTAVVPSTGTTTSSTKTTSNKKTAARKKKTANAVSSTKSAVSKAPEETTKVNDSPSAVQTEVQVDTPTAVDPDQVSPASEPTGEGYNGFPRLVTINGNGDVTVEHHDDKDSTSEPGPKPFGMVYFISHIFRGAFGPIGHSKKNLADTLMAIFGEGWTVRKLGNPSRTYPQDIFREKSHLYTAIRNTVDRMEQLRLNPTLPADKIFTQVYQEIDYPNNHRKIQRAIASWEKTRVINPPVVENTVSVETAQTA